MKTPSFLQENVDITELSNFKTIAKAKFYFEINTIEDVKKLETIVDFSKKENLKILFIWWWTNMLFAFEIYNWIVIKNNLKGYKYNEKTKNLEAYSSEMISDIAIDLLKNYKQNLWKRFVWLPWSVWWAVFWNAWCFWLETSWNFLKAEVLNLETYKIETLSKEDMNFDYRNSYLKQNNWKYFLIKAYFNLSENNEKYSSDVDNIYFREHRQPKWNTCGSFFKNPSKENPAWKLIDEAWLKWYRLWGASISDIHACFLMSDWNISHKDLLDLIELIQKQVKQKYGYDLEPEVRIIRN